MLGFNTTILDSKDMSASFTSEPLYLGPNSKYCFHAIYSDATSPVGTITIETSIDGTTWATLADSSYTVSAEGDKMYAVDRASYLLARLKYVRTSGSGTMTIHASIKE